MGRSAIREKLLAQHHRRFLEFLRPRVESEAVAEDILQDAYSAVLPDLKPEYAEQRDSPPPPCPGVASPPAGRGMRRLQRARLHGLHLPLTA